MIPEIVQGDITTLRLDAIVNAANEALLRGGGVNGAIHDAAGRELYDECKSLREVKPRIRLRTGQAVITKGYHLPAKHVIHTVGPVYDEVDYPRELLMNAYFNSLSVAEEHGLESIAFPAISTGIHGYPKDEALSVVKEILDNFQFKNVKRVVLCYFSDTDRRQAEEFFRGG